ncbi:MAG: hypothetical protein ACFFBD_06675, partial [Candidatus Hodarchaeota archaeon]
MNSIQKTVILLSVLLLSSILSPLVFLSGSSLESTKSAARLPEVPDLSEHIEPVNFTFFRNFHHQNKDNTIEFPEMNISSVLSQIDSFNASDVNVYAGNEIIPLNLTMYYVRVTLTQVEIYNDRDTIGPGEILFEISINGNYSIDDNDSSFYSANNGDIVYPNFIGFQGWLAQLEVNIHVWEADALIFDNDLGSFNYSTTAPTNETISGNTDIGDAHVSVQIEVLDTQTDLTAQHLLNGFKPSMSVCDETFGTELPNDVFGRVCIGEDDQLNTTAICLEYFYYWDKVTDPTGLIQIREDDYQGLLLFLDMNLDLYRVVFDAPNDIIDALPTHGYTIWEIGGSGTSWVTSNISEELQPFLGSNITVEFTSKDLETEAALITGLMGFQTIQFTVDTYFHGFQMGGTGILGTNYGFIYDVNELNDTIIHKWYEMLNDSLNAGIHTVQVGSYSYTLPQVTPFTFDIIHPFKYPYLVNAWGNVMDDLNAFTRAQTL